MRKAFFLALLLVLAAGYVGCATEAFGPNQEVHQLQGGEDVDDT
jgi:hypothetical protein|nr:MAG: hypothetical protein KatS3mg041_0872 [Bacteroidota bacterium]